MCGILGFTEDNLKYLKEGLSFISHRGPDDEGHFNSESFCMGMVRLSIVDISGGSQPQHTTDENLWIVFNGEIFNFLTIKEELESLGHQFYTNSDTEVIVHAYEEWGTDSFLKLRGQYAFAIYDISEKSLVIARDKLGISPLYYYYDGTNFGFSSEIKALFPFIRNFELREELLPVYLTFQYVPAPDTLLRNIYKVDAGCYVKVDLSTKSLTSVRYWNLDYTNSSKVNQTSAIAEIRDLIEESVKIRLMGEVPIGAYLSGGLDSSTVVAMMSRNMEKPVDTFSIGFEDPAPVNETKYARLVAEHFNTNHTEYTVESNSFDLLPQLVWHHDDLISDAAILPVFYLARLASQKGVKVIITGDGGDEVFGGYQRYNEVVHRYKYRKFFPSPVRSIFKLSSKLTPGKLSRILNYLGHANDKSSLYAPSVQLFYENEIQKMDFKDVKVLEQYLRPYFTTDDPFLHQMMKFDMRMQIPNAFNFKTDKMSMANSVESRVPLLDERLVSLLNRLPASWKMVGGDEKTLMKKSMKGIVPDVILNRKKQGFGTPVNYWISTGMNTISANLLESLDKRNIVSSTSIRKLINRRNMKSQSSKVWSLMLLELWYETFIEKDSLSIQKI